MTIDSQHAVVEFLSSPAAHGGAAVERIDTHSAIVFLAGARALKLKRAVRYDYLDFSTPALRRAACEAEVRINRRTAPSIYRGVAAVTEGPGGTLALNGPGTPLDWCVDMVRFDQDALLDRLAARGALDRRMTERLAEAVARFHLAADRRRAHGGYDGMRWVIDGNAVGLAEYGPGILNPDACTALTDRAREALLRHDSLLERRRAQGFVRQCHGDLHLRNLVLLEGQPTPFDAVEFNDDIACVDVFYDLAFLLMDLCHRGLPRHANVLLNGYLARTLDFEGLALLPVFLSCRAAIGAKTSATAARLQTAPQQRQELETLAREYFSMANAVLQPSRPQLIAIGGFSGSGKSTLALSVAPAIGPVPGALVLRSDEIRKGLLGVEPLEHLESSAYVPEVTGRVYAMLVDRARAAVRARHSVVADAVFARPADRDAIAAAAADASVPFVGFWLDAPASALIARVGQRPADASDADTSVVRQQLFADPGPILWRRLDAARAPENVLAQALERIASDARLAGPAPERPGPTASRV